MGGPTPLLYGDAAGAPPLPAEERGNQVSPRPSSMGTRPAPHHCLLQGGETRFPHAPARWGRGRRAGVAPGRTGKSGFPTPLLNGGEAGASAPLAAGRGNQVSPRPCAMRTRLARHRCLRQGGETRFPRAPARWERGRRATTACGRAGKPGFPAPLPEDFGTRGWQTRSYAPRRAWNSAAWYMKASRRVVRLVPPWASKAMSSQGS